MRIVSSGNWPKPSWLKKAEMMQMTTKTNPDPTDALLQLLKTKELHLYVPETFFGEGATFLTAVQSDRGPEVVGHLEAIEAALDPMEDFKKFASRWAILKNIAKIRAGQI